MGQYYKPININKKQWVYSHEFNSGLKLMEHSWIKNPFVQAVESLLTIGGAWYKNQIVWAGDYADEEPNSAENLYSMTTSDDGKDRMQKIKPSLIKNIEKSYPFIVNHSKKEFVDKRLVPIKEGWKIHPLPLLTCEGNGRGGGDFHGESDLIGRWARDSISVEEEAPKGYEMIDFNLTE